MTHRGHRACSLMNRHANIGASDVPRADEVALALARGLEPPFPKIPINAVLAIYSSYITAMLATLRDLFCHQAFTDAAF